MSSSNNPDLNSARSSLRRWLSKAEATHPDRQAIEAALEILDGIDRVKTINISGLLIEI